MIFGIEHDQNALNEGMREPDYQGKRGRAWKCDLDAMRKELGPDAKGDGTLVNWVIEAPYAHPFWHSYALVLVHLRPTERLPNPVLNTTGATHEFWLWALTPEADRPAIVRGDPQAGLPFLEPMNFGAQLVEANDDEAMQRIEDTMKDICDGVLNPDTDFQQLWVNRFGDSLFKLEHRKPATETMQ